MARWQLGAKLRRQDWAAVGIDLVIVVVGVFLGIQASNWNDDRRNRRDADSYLRRISEDLRSDIKQLDDRETYWRSSAEAGDRALRFAEDGVSDGSAWYTLLDFYGAGQIWSYSPNDETYRELVSAGRLDLVRDISLRKAFAAYYVGEQTQAALLFKTLPAYRADIRGAVPYRMQRYILDHCQTGLSSSFRAIRCAPPEKNVDYGPAVRAIAANPKLIGELRSWMTTLRYMRAVGREQHDSAAAMVERISGSGDRRP